MAPLCDCNVNGKPIEMQGGTVRLEANLTSGTRIWWIRGFRPHKFLHLAGLT